MIRLHEYWRSMASYRVRIGLNLKGVRYAPVLHDLRLGEQADAVYAEISPQRLVPALETDEGTLIQSSAILEWLDERYPDRSLLPTNPFARAIVRSMAAVITCDIHPLNNLRVLRYLHRSLGHDEAALEIWYNHWIDSGFRALEQLLADGDRTGRFCHGDEPGLADIALVPQVVNAERYRLDLAPFPTIPRIFETCMQLDAFAAAHPQQQPDRGT